MKNNTRYAIALMPLMLVAKTEPDKNNFDKQIYSWSQTMAEAFHILNQKYYQTVDPEKAMIKAIDAFVSRDPHSKLLDPKSFKEILEATQGEFGGIGVIIDNTKEPEDEYIRIIDTLPNEPADKAGIKANDKIVQINNEILKGVTIEEATAKLKGKINTKVTLKVHRPSTNALLNFEIERALIKEQNAVCYYFNDNNIHYISLNMFTENSVKQIEQLLKKCHEQKSKGLILDLRNNSGGLLSSVVDIAGLFLEKGSLVVTTKDRNEKVIEVYTTTRKPITDKSIPIIILVNNYTASAAEILAGCLQFYSEKAARKSITNNLLVFVAGSKTFGKGSVQEVIPVSNDCAIKLTTALYYLPNDVSIQAIGIQPDLEITSRYNHSEDLTWFTTFFGHEHTLKNAIKNETHPKKNQEKESKKKAQKPEKKDDEPEKTWQEKKQEQIGSDYLILSTIRMLELLTMGVRAFPEKTTTRKDCLTFLTKAYVVNDAPTLQEVKI